MGDYCCHLILIESANLYLLTCQFGERWWKSLEALKLAGATLSEWLSVMTQQDLRKENWLKVTFCIAQTYACLGFYGGFPCAFFNL